MMRAGRECYHCKQWIEPDEAHDCWTTTEAALTRDLSEDLRDAWERLRETAAAFGDQRIYASHKSIMFSRRSCYFFVRPKRSFLELCVFLGRPLKAPQVRRVDRASKNEMASVKGNWGPAFSAMNFWPSSSNCTDITFPCARLIEVTFERLKIEV